jgi:hypothetical protein
MSRLNTRRLLVKLSIGLALFAFWLALAPATTTQSLSATSALKFVDFPASIFTGKPAKVRLEGSGDRLFRTRLREAARKGPDFAGHFTVAQWGCGSGCLNTAVIDAISGRIYWTGPLTFFTFPYLGTKTGREYQGMVYRLDSRLLVADGCPGEEENPAKCGTYYYEWRNQRMKLLRFDKLLPNTK